MSNPNRFKIYEKSNVVVDFQNFLMWQRDIRIATWEEADKTAKLSNSSGFSDWRLPTIEELQTLLEGIPEGQTEGEFLKGKGEYGFYWSRGLWNLEGKYHPETKEVNDDKKTTTSGEKLESAHCDTSKSDDSEPNNGMWLDDNLEKKIWTDSFFWSSSDYDEWESRQKKEKTAEPEENDSDIDRIELMESEKIEFKAGIFFSSGKIGCRYKDSEIPKYYFCVRKFERPKPEVKQPIDLQIVDKRVSHKSPDSGNKPPSNPVLISKPKLQNNDSNEKSSFVLPVTVTVCLVTVVLLVIFFFRYREESDPSQNPPVSNKNIVKSDNSIELVPKPDDGEKVAQNSPLPQKETIPTEKRTKCGRSFRNSGFTWCRATGRPTDWEQANEYCRNIWDDRKTGWRLPTFEEFEMLKQNGNIDIYFLDRQQQFWRSEGKNLYWDRLEEYGEDLDKNKKIKKADFLCIRKNR